MIWRLSIYWKYQISPISIAKWLIIPVQVAKKLGLQLRLYDIKFIEIEEIYTQILYFHILLT